MMMVLTSKESTPREDLMHRQDRQNRHLIYGSKIKGDARLFTSAIKLGHVPLSPRSLPRTLGMIRRPVSLSGVTSGSFSIRDADGDSLSFSRCEALAPMISKFIIAQWESEEVEGVDDEWRQILEEAAELDSILVNEYKVKKA